MPFNCTKSSSYSVCMLLNSDCISGSKLSWHNALYHLKLLELYLQRILIDMFAELASISLASCAVLWCQNRDDMIKKAEKCTQLGLIYMGHLLLRIKLT